MTVCNYIVRVKFIALDCLPVIFFLTDFWPMWLYESSCHYTVDHGTFLSYRHGTEYSNCIVLLKELLLLLRRCFFLDVTISGKQFWDFLLLLILNIQIGPVNKHHHQHALCCGSIADVVWRIKVYCVNTMRHVVLNNFTEIKLCRFSLKGAIHTQINSLIIYSPFCW